ncbi:ubiquitin-protein transferase activity protein [Homalodisca vitripennis]|nr:ubiquitin-protein transferase activity protein [Homalodisca vitripennis]
MCLFASEPSDENNDNEDLQEKNKRHLPTKLALQPNGKRGYQHKSETGTTNHLYRLNLKTLEWKRLFPMGDWPVCCDKMAGWVYQDKIEYRLGFSGSAWLYFFGGFGPVGRCRNEFQIVLEPTSELSPWPTGWNNQLAVYNIELDCWEWPRCRGSIPAPRAAHAAAISENRVYVFGGRLRLIRNNELHCLDLDTMTWSGNLTDASKSECGVPEGRTWHTLTFISPDKAVLYGGLSQYNAVLKTILNNVVLLTFGNSIANEETVNRRSSQILSSTASTKSLVITDG